VTTRNRPPDYLPEHVRDHPEVVKACQAHDIGKLFRLVNNLTDGPGRFTQSHLARRCELTPSRVAEYMDGKHQTVSLAVIVRVADGLHIPGARFGLASCAWEADSATSFSRSEQDDPLLRRTLLTSIAGMTTALVGLTPDTTERVSSAIGGNRVDDVTVAELRSIAAGYRRAYRSLPAGALLQLAHGQINLVMALHPAQQHNQRRIDLLTQLGEMAALAAVLSFLDLRNQEAGDAYLNLAHQAARATGSPELLALVFAGRAFNLTYAGDHDSGLDCALAAVRYSEMGVSARMRAWVAAVASEMHATVGDQGSCLAALDVSREALSGEIDDGNWAGIGAFDMNKVDAYEGGDLVRLGEYGRALPFLDAALQQLDSGMTRHRCTAHIDRAEALAASGEVEASCHDSGKALILLEQTHHTQSLSRVTNLYRAVRPANTLATRALATHLIHIRSVVTAGSHV
jgi:transcriptional regulator with XRE-family HTH domain